MVTKIGSKLNTLAEKVVTWINSGVGRLLAQVKPRLAQLRDFVNKNKDRVLAPARNFTRVAVAFAESVRDLPFGGAVNTAAGITVQVTSMLEKSVGIANTLADLPDKISSVDGVLDLIFR